MAKGVHVGDAWVAVHPETKNFYHKIADQLSKMGNKDKDQPRVEVRPDIDRDKWQKDFNDAFSRESDKPKIAVGFDKEHSTLRQELAREFRNQRLTVGVQLSQGDKARIGRELDEISHDRILTVRVRTQDFDDKDFYSQQLAARERARKELEKDIDSAVANNYVKRNVVRLELDKEQVYQSLRSLGKLDVPIEFDTATLHNSLADIYENWFNEDDPWELEVGIERTSLAKTQAKLKELAADRKKTFTIHYKESTAKDSKSALARFKSLTEGDGLTARVNLVPDDEALNAALDIQKPLTLRPELSKVAYEKVEAQLDKLTRPRMVEILTGEMRFSGFAEDLSQALQTAWDELDPRLSFKDVFDDVDARPARYDRDAVHKVFVVNQVETTPAPGTTPTLDNPEPVSVADVDTKKPVTTRPATGADGAPVVRVSGDRDVDVPSGFYDRVAKAMLRGRASTLTGDPDAILAGQLRVFGAQMDLFEKRAARLSNPVENITQGRGLFRDDLVYQQRVLSRALEQFSKLAMPGQVRFTDSAVEALDSRRGRIGQLEGFIARATKRLGYTDAQADNERLFVEFLRKQIAYLDGRGPRRGVDDAGVELRIQRNADALAASFERLTEGTKRAWDNLLDPDRDAGLSERELELRSFNRARLEVDPTHEYVSMGAWRKMTEPPRQKLAFDWDSLHSTDAFSQAVENMTAPNGRDGMMKFYAKNLAHSVLKPFGKVADMAWGATHSTAKNALSGAAAAPFKMSKGIVDVSKSGLVSLPDMDLGPMDSSPLPVMKPGKAGDPTAMLTQLGSAAKKVVGPVTAVGSVLGALVGLHTKMGAFGIALGGVSESILGLGAMGSAVLAPFANSLKSIMFAPALFTSLAAGVGAAVLAFQGVGDAFTDGEAFADLQANAQGFVSATKDMKPAFDQLQDSVQQGFFTGWGEAMNDLATNTMPALQRSLPAVAEGFGGLGQTFIETLGRDDVAKNLEATLLAAGDGFERMRPGMEAFTDFWMQVSRVGAETLMPKLGDGFSSLMDSWRDWATDDNLTAMFDSALDGLSKVSDFAGTAWSGLSDFFRGAADGADSVFGTGGVWGAMMDKLEQFRDWAGSAKGQESLQSFFHGATESAVEVGKILGEWGEKIVTETGPAFRDFIRDHGADIEDIGSSLIDTMTNGMYAIGPILEMIKGPLEMLAQTAKIANELAGGPGSEKRREEMGKKAANADDWVSSLYDSKDPTTFRVDGSTYIDDDGQEVQVSSKRNRAAREQAYASIVEMDNQISANAAGYKDDPGFANYVDQMNRLQVAYEGLRGGFADGRASVDATAATLKALGESIVAIPDEKSVVVTAEGTEQQRAELERLGATVEELGDGTFSIEFEGGMELQGAIEQIRAEMDGMSDIEIEARGLDDLYSQLMDLSQETMRITVDVEGDDLANVRGELEGLSGFTEINGQVHLDTNAPDVQAWLIDIGAAKDINGTFIMASNAQEVIAEVLSIPTSTVGAHEISTNYFEALAQIWALNNANTASTHTIQVVQTVLQNTAKVAAAVNMPGLGALGVNVDGSVTRAANGFAGRQAGVAKAGSYILWAENETEDESYIPHALSKRKRSTQILVQTANDFGLHVVDNNGNFVTRDATSVAPTTLTPMANGGTTRSQRLREENRARATAEANAKTKDKPKASAAQKAQLAGAEQRADDIEALRDKEYARRLVAIERGQFVYRDTDPDHDDAVLAVDRAGLIPHRVGMRGYIERDEEVSPRTLAMLAAMEADGYTLPPEGERLMRQHGHMLPPEVRYRIRHRNELPAHVRHALLTGESIDDPDAPVDVDAQLNSRDWQRAFHHIAADPQDRTRWENARWMVHDETVALGRHIGESYAEEGTSLIGLNATRPRDIPLYNLFNPSADAYNELIGSVNTGRRELEGDYRDRYRTESEIRREAERTLRENQRADSSAEKAQDKTAEQIAKDIAAQDKKNAEAMAQYNAGMKAVQDHRAAQRAATARTTTTRAGLTVNQTIGNITTNSAQDAADRFRRQATVGFENLAGVI